MATAAAADSAGRVPSSRAVFWLLVLLAAGLLLPFTTALHNICLPQTAASELVPLAGILFLILGAAHAGEIRLVRMPLLLPLGAFLAVCLLSTLLAPLKYAAVEALIRCVAYAVIFFLTIQAVRTRGDLARLTAAVFAVMAVSVGYGLLQAAGKDPASLNLAARRIVGTQGAPPLFAAVLVLMLPVMLAAVWLARSRIWKTAAALLAIAALTCLVLTESRAGLLSFGAVLLGGTVLAFFLFPERRRLGRLTAAGGFLALASVVAAHRPRRERVVAHFLDRQSGDDTDQHEQAGDPKHRRPWQVVGQDQGERSRHQAGKTVGVDPEGRTGSELVVGQQLAPVCVEDDILARAE